VLKHLLKSALRRLGYDIRALPQPARYARLEEHSVRDHEALKEFTGRAAQFCASAEQANVIRNLFLTGLRHEQRQESVSEIEIGDASTLSVGVWRRQAPGAEIPFIRDPKKSDEWFYWADLQRIEPKRTRWRVVLLGESVARGYFYDPQFNLATTARTMLESELGHQSIDMVDLAKTNLRMPELKACIGKSLALSPDVIVIFAGNNWHSHLSESDIPFVESLLRRAGVPAMKGYLDERRRQATRNLISQANQLLGSRNVKIIWVIPETNLTDWKDLQTEAPLLAGSGNTRWRELHRQLGEALRSEDPRAAQALAEEMHALDHGTSSVPLRFLAERSKARGDVDSARRHLELCRDAVGWDPTFSYPPRVFSPIQEALREAATLPGNAVVDLPSVFRRHLDGQLPGRRMFLDYCHMAAEGINVAGAEIASHVLSLVAAKQVSAIKLLSNARPPPAKIEGKACLIAAAHNAAYYQNVDIVQYWCGRALAFWPECAPLMARFADYAMRDLPIVMCKSGLELSERDELGVVPHLLHGRPRRLDLTFSDAAVTALGEVGVDMQESIAHLRIQEHSIRSGPKELTDFFYSAAVPARCEHGWTSRAFPTNHGSHSIYASAFWPTSNFVFFAAQDQDVAITLTFRVRSGSTSEAGVRVDVNGRHIAALTAERTWCTQTISVPREYLEEGLNDISISWPADEVPSDALLAEAANSLLASRLPYLHRVFGEIHSLRIAARSMAGTSAVRI
jgi:hypothetical protein